MKEIKLRRKYTDGKGGKSHKKSNHGGNSGHSAGKHAAHPAIPGYRRNGYSCDQKWNRKDKE